MTAGIGHNSGQVAEAGFSWRKHVWTKARRDLMPTLPIEVVRLRVRRAQELGLPYKTYAGIRASTGHDLIGFMFSSNALRVLRDTDPLPDDRADRLAALAAQRVALVQPPLRPAMLAHRAGLDAAHTAPGFALSWAAGRDHLKAVARACGHPADRYVIVGDTAVERDWVAMAGAAGWIAAAAYFPDGTDLRH